jgi:hypothetical protein
MVDFIAETLWRHMEVQAGDIWPRIAAIDTSNFLSHDEQTINYDVI